MAGGTNGFAYSSEHQAETSWRGHLGSGVGHPVFSKGRGSERQRSLISYGDSMPA